MRIYGKIRTLTAKCEGQSSNLLGGNSSKNRLLLLVVPFGMISRSVSGNRHFGTLGDESLPLAQHQCFVPSPFVAENHRFRVAGLARGN